MVREESLISSEAWQDIANSGEHFNKLIKVFTEFTCDLPIIDISNVRQVQTSMTYMEEDPNAAPYRTKS